MQEAKEKTSLQLITIYSKDGSKNISFSVNKIISGYKESGDIGNVLEFEAENGETGRVFLNKDAVMAVVISPIREPH